MRSNDPSSGNILVLGDRNQRWVSSLLLEEQLLGVPPGVRSGFLFPSDGKGDLLKSVVAGIQAADRVLVVHPPDPGVVSAAFETGIALGLRKPIALLEDRLTPALPLAFSIELLTGSRFPEAAILSREDLSERLHASDAWHQIDLPGLLDMVPEEDYRVALCARDERRGGLLRRLLQEARPDWSAPFLEEDPYEVARQASRASRLLWMVTETSRPMHRQRGNVVAALAAGLFQARHPAGTPQLEVFRDREAPTIPSLQRQERVFEGPEELRALLEPQAPGPEPFAVQTLEIRNFKNIRHLKLDLTPPSSLAGDWTCIAGINGAGKTSILQALSLVLLSEGLVREIGGERLRKLVRRTAGQDEPAHITAEVHDGSRLHTLQLQIDPQGTCRSSPPPDDRVWAWLQSQVVVSYGASRNLSEFRDTRYTHLSLPVQRQMGLFDSLTQVASIEVLLEGGPSSVPVLQTLKRLLETLLKEELAPSLGTDRLVFGQCGAEVEAVDLPDGFRSMLAWLADLCAAWHRTASPAETAAGDPARIRGLVQLDEIDLHLHPSLQRSLVPRLRQALPKVQFIVTTHSPLVLSSFDQAELVVLDRDEEDGIRELDRQIFGFSTDQVYEWLMETPPQSRVIEEKLEAQNDPDLALYLYQTQDRSEEEARAQLEERRRILEELLGQRQS